MLGLWGIRIKDTRVNEVWLYLYGHVFFFSSLKAYVDQDKLKKAAEDAEQGVDGSKEKTEKNGADRTQQIGIKKEGEKSVTENGKETNDGEAGDVSTTENNIRSTSPEQTTIVEINHVGSKGDDNKGANDEPRKTSVLKQEDIKISAKQREGLTSVESIATWYLACVIHEMDLNMSEHWVRVYVAYFYGVLSVVH